MTRREFGAAIAAGSERSGARGWFGIGQAGARSVFTTPEGQPFVAFGVNHIGAAGGAARQAPARLREWGFNSLGYDAPRELEQTMPYFAAMTIARNEKHRSHPAPGAADSYEFPDVFDAGWQESVDKRMAQVCSRHRENRLLIGYFWTDTPTWDVVKTRGLRATDWVSEIRRLPAASAGRRRYAEFLAARYQGRLDGLNLVYGLGLRGLEELAAADLSNVAIGRHAVGEDDRAFLGVIARQYYETVGRAHRNHDANHLVLGERYLAGDAPENVLQAAAPFIDAVSVQPGDRYTELYPPGTVYPEEEIERMRRVTGKPVMICDHAISFPTAEHPKTIFEQAPTDAEAARLTTEFLRRAMAQTYVLGYLRCQYIDRPAAFGRGLRQGLLDADGQARRPMVEAYRKAFSEWSEAVRLGASRRSL